MEKTEFIFELVENLNQKMKPIIDFVKKNLDLFSEAVLKTKSIFEFMENLNQMMKLNFDNFKKH